MSRSLGKSRSDLYSHTHSRGRAPSLYARLLGVAVLLGLTGSPVLPLSLAPGQESNPERSESARDEKAPSLGEQISARISQLADSSYTVREEAGRAIVEFGSAALPELRRALGCARPGQNHHSPVVRRRRSHGVPLVGDRLEGGLDLADGVLGTVEPRIGSSE